MIRYVMQGDAALPIEDESDWHDHPIRPDQEVRWVNNIREFRWKPIEPDSIPIFIDWEVYIGEDNETN